MQSPQGSVSSILIIKPSSLGDVVHTLPAVALLRKAFPQSKIRWLINPEWAPLIQDNPDIDEVIIFPRNSFRGIRSWKQLVAWIKSLTPYRSDIVLDFQGLIRSALIAQVCRHGKIYGLSDAREGAWLFYDHVAKVKKTQHAVDRYLRLVAMLGINTEKQVAFPLPQGELPSQFDISEPFILLHPFSRGTGKSLATSDVEKFCKDLAPFRVVLAGRADHTLHLPEHCTNLLNATSLTELIALIRKAAFVVSVDSGPMHIASALTNNLLSIHTWSDPLLVGPYNPEAWIWKSGQLQQVKNLKSDKPGIPVSDLLGITEFLKERCLNLIP